MKKLCESIREHGMEITNFKKISYENEKICYIYKEKFEYKWAKGKKYRKVRDHCYYRGEYRGAADSICNLKFRVPKEIPIVFHNGSNYDYHFIIKELTEKFKGQFTCLGENTEKYIIFHFQYKKKLQELIKKRGGES